MLKREDIKRVTSDILDQITFITDMAKGFLLPGPLSNNDKFLVSKSLERIRIDLSILAANIDDNNTIVFDVFNEMEISYKAYILYILKFISYVRETMLIDGKVIIIQGGDLKDGIIKCERDSKVYV